MTYEEFKPGIAYYYNNTIIYCYSKNTKKFTALTFLIKNEIFRTNTEYKSFLTMMNTFIAN
jgi:hypothetical protein